MLAHRDVVRPASPQAPRVLGQQRPFLRAAGVLALACDRLVEGRDGPAFSDVLLADLAARATVDAHGARWSNHEHRAEPSALAPRTGWAMGNAGIVRELLRLARIRAGRNPSYVVPWPDHHSTA